MWFTQGCHGGKADATAAVGGEIWCCFTEDTRTAKLSQGQLSLGPTPHQTLSIWTPSQTRRRSGWGRDTDAGSFASLSFTLSAPGTKLWQSQMPPASLRVNGGRRLSILCTTTIHLKCAVCRQLRHRPESTLPWHPQEGSRKHAPNGPLSKDSDWVVSWARILLDLSRSSSCLSPCDKEKACYDSSPFLKMYLKIHQKVKWILKHQRMFFFF